MRYVAAALLSALGGSDISEAGIKTILDSVGIEYDAEKAKKVMKKFI
jgi:ribosomal protein L12E/L44/L45/RPP1/RPP2